MEVCPIHPLAQRVACHKPPQDETRDGLGIVPGNYASVRVSEYHQVEASDDKGSANKLRTGAGRKLLLRGQAASEPERVPAQQRTVALSLLPCRVCWRVQGHVVPPDVAPHPRPCPRYRYPFPRNPAVRFAGATVYDLVVVATRAVSRRIAPANNRQASACPYFHGVELIDQLPVAP